MPPLPKLAARYYSSYTSYTNEMKYSIKLINVVSYLSLDFINFQIVLVLPVVHNQNIKR